MSTERSQTAPSLAELVRSATSGDTEAEAEVLARVAGSIRVYARRRLRALADSEEFVQDVLLQLIAALRDGTIDEPERFGAYALGVCRNLTRGAVRKRERRAELWDKFGERISPCLQACALEVEQGHAQLEDCLAQLEARAREIVGRTYYDDHSGPEIAEALALTPVNVRVIRLRAMKALRTCMRAKPSWEAYG